MSESGERIGARYGAIAHERLMEEIRQAEARVLYEQSSRSARKLAYDAITNILKRETQEFNEAVGIDSEKMTMSSTADAIHFGVIRRRMVSLEFTDTTLAILMTEHMSPFAVPRAEYAILWSPAGPVKFQLKDQASEQLYTIEQMVDSAFGLVVNGDLQH